MKKIIIILVTIFATFFLGLSFPQNTLAGNIEVIPKAENENPGTIVECVSSIGGPDCDKGTVWDRYNKELTRGGEELDLGTQFATGVFSWNSIKLYIVYIIRFLLQIGLLIGAVMIIIAGYKYATAVYKGSDPGKKDIANAIVGVLVIIFSYAIIRVLQAVSGIG